MVDRGDVKWTIIGRNIEVTPALRDYAEKRVSKAIKHFDPERQTIAAEVYLTVEREQHIAEVTLKVDRLIVRSEARTHDLYASLDEASDRIERQIRKYKTRLKRRAVDGPKLGELAAEASQRAQAEEELAAKAETNHLPKVVRQKRFALKPMDVEEAILQMELLGHDFFVFANAATSEVNVLYRRQDGNLGLIEPELA